MYSEDGNWFGLGKWTCSNYKRSALAWYVRWWWYIKLRISILLVWTLMIEPENRFCLVSKFSSLQLSSRCLERDKSGIATSPQKLGFSGLSSWCCRSSVMTFCSWFTGISGSTKLSPLPESFLFILLCNVWRGILSLIWYCFLGWLFTGVNGVLRRGVKLAGSSSVQFLRV